VNAYDAGTNGISRLTSVSDAAGTGAYTFDVMGHVATEQRTNNGITQSMAYSYYVDGSLKTMQYPSGTAISYQSDNFHGELGRPILHGQSGGRDRYHALDQLCLCSNLCKYRGDCRFC
jgi:hypothetical protein